MAGLILIAFGVFFLFGLVQWARSGAVLWDIVRLSRRRTDNGGEKTAEERQASKARTGKALREMEKLTDSLLRSSFRVLGVLALCVWLFIIASVVIDAMGLDWLDNLSFRAASLWGDPFTRSGYVTQPRNAPGGTQGNVLRSLGSGLRRQ
jgi:hypothetical protein